MKKKTSSKAAKAKKVAEVATKGSPKSKPTGTSSSATSSHRWTFLTNHTHVLGLIHTDPDLVLRQVAFRVGITERAVQRIVLDLEEQGYLVRERVGRRNRYQVVTDLPLRHPIEAHRNIGDLLELVANREEA
ncbi:MAG: ArsR family transcriptional regulator [bacterium]|nr:ArsR family transcriptional regulator [bacterium]